MNITDLTIFVINIVITGTDIIKFQKDGLMHKTEKFNGHLALLIEMENGRRISRLESQILFGVQNLTADISQLKRQGYMIKSKKVPMARILKRMNDYCTVIPPKQLPVRDIMVSEYWISK